jgi:hypothetical protein
MAKRGSRIKVLSVAERKRLSAIRALPLHRTTLSIRDAVAAKKQWRCHLPPHIHSIYSRLTRRLQYAKRRCESKNCTGYKHYGARGIKFLFGSTREAVLWVMEHLPHPTYDGLEIDRIDNNGYYAPGNLQLSTRRVNANNRLTTFWVPTRHGHLAMQDFIRHYPRCGYGRDQIKTLVELGLTGEQIARRWRIAKGKHINKRKGGPRGPYKKRSSTIL